MIFQNKGEMLQINRQTLRKNASNKWHFFLVSRLGPHIHMYFAKLKFCIVFSDVLVFPCRLYFKGMFLRFRETVPWLRTNINQSEIGNYVNRLYYCFHKFIWDSTMVRQLSHQRWTSVVFRKFTLRNLCIKLPLHLIEAFFSDVY